jgi:hypothetical protein
MSRGVFVCPLRTDLGLPLFWCSPLPRGSRGARGELAWFAFVFADLVSLLGGRTYALEIC